MAEVGSSSVRARRQTPAGRARREQILTAALRCVTRYGAAATTIEQIRSESGASIGSIYHHLGGKDAIVAELYCAALDDYQDRLTTALTGATSTRTAFRAGVAAHLDWVRERVDLAKLMLAMHPSELAEPARSRVVQARRSFAGVIRSYLSKRVDAGEIRRLTPAVYDALLLGPLLEYSRLQLAHRARQDDATAARELADGIWRALAPETRPDRR